MVHGLVDFALWAAARATDHLELVFDDVDALVDATQRERQQQRADLQAIVDAARTGVLAVDAAPVIRSLRHHS